MQGNFSVSDFRYNPLSEIIIDIHHSANPLGQQSQLIVNVSPESISVRILFIAEELHPNQVGDFYASDKRVLSKPTRQKDHLLIRKGKPICLAVF